MTSNNMSSEQLDNAVQKYIADNYSMVHLASSRAMRNLIEHIEAELKNKCGWTDLSHAIEKALYSTTSFALTITYERAPIADGGSQVVAKIPVDVASIASRMRNVEIVNLIHIVQDKVVDTTTLEELTHAMPSLEAQLPDLETFTILLRIRCEGIKDEQAKSGAWAGFAASEGQHSVKVDTSASPSPVRAKVDALLQAAQLRGPGKTKKFKLFMVRSYSSHEKVSPGWKPWYRRSEDIEFQSLDDLSDVLQEAMDSSVETLTR